MRAFGLKTVITACLAFSLLDAAISEAQELWYLPQEFDTHNISVRFEVDSTWHLVEGDTQNVTGKVWLSDPANYSSVRANLELPVAMFDTHNDRRDTRLRQVMDADEFPKVTFLLNETLNLCEPKAVQAGHICPFTIRGQVKIRDVSQELEIPANISYDRAQKAYFVAGEVNLKWQEFGIEDPSIFIAKVNPIVKIIISISLRDRSKTA